MNYTEEIQKRLVSCLDEVARISNEIISVYTKYEDVFRACEMSYVSGLVSEISPEEPFVMMFGDNPLSAIKAVVNKYEQRLEEGKE